MVEQGDERDERPGDEEDAGDLDWLHELEEAAETTPAGEPETPAAEALPEWLEGEAGEAPGLDWLGDLDEGDRPFDRMAVESPPSDEMAAWVRSEVGDVDPAGEDLSWLDQIAGGEAEPPEEMPTLEWPEEEEEPLEPAGEEPADEALEASYAPPMNQELDWLDALASDEAVADDTWLEELELEGDDFEASDQGSEPKLFTDEISGLEWLDEPLAEADLEAGALSGAGDDQDEGLDWLEEIGAAAAEEAGEVDWLEEAGAGAMTAGDAGDERPFSWDEEIDAESEALAAGQMADTGDVPKGGGEAASAELAWLDEYDAEDGEAVTATPAAAEGADLLAADEFIAAEDEEPRLDWLEGEDEAQPVADAEPDSPAEEDSIDDGAAAPQPGEEEAELEEALTWLDEVPEGVAFEQEEAVPQDLEEAMAWVDAGETEGVDAGEVPEDLDEAMAWLEQLAAQQGAPLEELPSLSAAEPEETASAPIDWDEEPAELELAAAETPEMNLEWMEALAEADEEPAVEAGAGAAPDAEESFDVPEDLDEAMAWLESLAARQGAPLDELPSIGEDADFLEDILAEDATISDPAEEFEEAPYIAEAGAPDELEEAMAWLDELAAQQAAPVEAEPAMPVAESEPWADVEPEPATSLEGELEEEPAALPVSEEPTPEAMVVPDVAMMYLDSLVEHGGESETAGEPAAALAEEIPDDLDGMMAWLEQLSSGAEPQLSEPASAEWDDTLEAADEAQMAEPASALEEEEPSLAFDEEAEPELEMTDLSWLPEEPAEELALEPPELEPEGAVDFGEVPEDPDEVMAWLERLAARQGAPLDELPTVDEVSDEVETPDWLAADLAEAEGEVWPAAAEEMAAPEETLSEEDADAGWLAGAPVVAAAEESEKEAAWLDEETGLEWLDAVTSDEPAEGLAWLEEPPAAPASEQEQEVERLDFPTLDEDSESLMPDWLTLDEAEWDDEEPDIASWLVAEEELSQVSLETPPAASVPPALAGADREPQAEAARPAQRLPAAADMDIEQLETAREALDSGDLGDALNRYQDLLQAGAGLNVLIADLELATEAGYDPTLCRVLGDAYMQNGQLDRALDIYRKGLDRL